MASDPDQPMLRPALLAAALAPLCAELLTATAPPRTFFDPLPAWYRLLLYGSGVLVVHECAVTWKRGWPGLLLLGLAFGTVVEGLVSRSMFCTEWLRIGLLGDYGHWLGINWHWSLLLLVFHAVYSIALPVLVAELVWPDSRNRHWLDPAVTQMLVMGLLAGALYGRQNALPASPQSFWIACGLLGGWVYLARHAPAPRRPPRRFDRPGGSASLPRRGPASGCWHRSCYRDWNSPPCSATCCSRAWCCSRAGAGQSLPRAGPTATGWG